MTSVSRWPESNRHELSGNRALCGPPARSMPVGGAIRRDYARVVGETTMNQRNGSAPAPPNGVAKDMGELTHDLASLAELQFELFRNDCREGIKRLRSPTPLPPLAGIVAAGTIPVARLSLPRSSLSCRPIAGGGLFNRCSWRLHHSGGPGSCGVVQYPRSGAGLRVPAKN